MATKKTTKSTKSHEDAFYADSKETGSAGEPAEVETPFEYESVKVLNSVTWKWFPEVSKYFRVDSEVFKGKEFKGTGSKITMAPADICNVTDLRNGESRQLVLGKIIHDIITDPETYPKKSYVGKCFKAVQHLIPGKRYKGYTVEQIKEPKGLKARS